MLSSLKNYITQKTMKNKFLINFFLFLFCMLAFSAFAAGPEVIYEQAYLIKSKGIKTGFVYEVRKKINQKIITEQHIEQRYKRQGDNVEIIQDQMFIENESGRPLEFSFISKNAGEDVVIKGEFDWLEEKIIIKSVVNGIKNTKILDINDKIIFPNAIDNLYKNTEDKIFRYYTLEPGISTKILKIKAKQVEDGEIKKYELDVNIFPNNEITEWRDVNGRIVKTVSSIMDIEQVAVDKKEIVGIKNTFNIFPESLIKVEKIINNPDIVEKVIYKITAKTLMSESIFPESSTQKIIQVKDNTLYLKVEAEDHEDYKYPYPFESAGFEEYLKSGPFINYNNEKIKKIVEELKTGEADAVKLAQKAQKWVYTNINDKTLSVDFADSVQTLESKQGDCTEHSILLSALLRGAGIPAKPVVGLVYTREPERAFVYHMWVKAYVGKWINLDPSMPYDTFTPLHLAMAESPLNDVFSKTELCLAITNSFSKIDIEILNVIETALEKVRSLPRVKLKEQEYFSSEYIVNIKLNRTDANENNIQNVILSREKEERDHLKTAFYYYTKGDTKKAEYFLRQYYVNISPEDDYAKMKLVMKLISMAYLNFAAEVLDEINEKEIWGKMTDELYLLYFPKNFMPEKVESVQVTANYLLNYTDKPEYIIELTEKSKEYDSLYYLRSKAQKKMNNIDGALESINKALEINPDNLNYRLDQINLLSVKNEIELALEGLLALKKDAQGLDIKNKDFWKTYNIIEKWLQVKQFRDNPVASMYYKAYYYAVKDEYQEALDILNKLVYKREEAYLFELLGELSFELGNYEGARKAFKKALSSDENRVKALIGVGNIYFITGKNELSEKYYQEAVDKFPKNIEALKAMAKLHGYLGNTKEAYDYFRKILEIDSNNTDVIYNIGIILANSGKLTEAEKMLKKALSSDPMGSYIWMDLVQIELARNNYSNAVKYLHNIYHMDENNPYYYYYMAVIFNKNNKKAEADKYLKKAIDINPDLVKEITEANKL